MNGEVQQLETANATLRDVLVELQAASLGAIDIASAERSFSRLQPALQSVARMVPQLSGAPRDSRVGEALSRYTELLSRLQPVIVDLQARLHLERDNMHRRLRSIHHAQQWSDALRDTY